MALLQHRLFRAPSLMDTLSRGHHALRQLQVKLELLILELLRRLVTIRRVLQLLHHRLQLGLGHLLQPVRVVASGGPAGGSANMTGAARTCQQLSRAPAVSQPAKLGTLLRGCRSVDRGSGSDAWAGTLHTTPGPEHARSPTTCPRGSQAPLARAGGGNLPLGHHCVLVVLQLLHIRHVLAASTAEASTSTHL